MLLEGPTHAVNAYKRVRACVSFPLRAEQNSFDLRDQSWSVELRGGPKNKALPYFTACAVTNLLQRIL